MTSIVAKMPLRTLLMSLVSLLVLAALMLAVSNLLQSRAVYRDAQILAERNRLADRCMRAMSHFGFERGRSAVVLRGTRPVSQEYRRFIDDQRVLADADLADLLLLSSNDSGFDSSNALQAWKRVKDLRAELDADFDRALDARDQQLPGVWLDAANDLITRLELLLVDISSFPGKADASFERLSTMRILVSQFRDLIGVEANTIAGELSSGRGMSRMLIGMVNQLRGRSMAVWSQLVTGVERLGDEETVAALDKVRDALLMRLQPMQDDILQAAANGSPIKVELSDYLVVSVAALNSTVELADGINFRAGVYVTQQLELAKRQQRMSLVSIAAILLLGGLVVLVLSKRFTRPLNSVIAHINSLHEIHLSDSPATLPAGDGDELDQVQRALSLLDEAIKARLHSEAALNESERTSALILASVPQAIIVTNVDGTITVFSPGAEKMLGYPADEIVGKQTPLVLHDPDEVRKQARRMSDELGDSVSPGFEAFVARIRVDGQPDEHEWTMIRKDGSRLTVLLAIAPLRGARGELSGFLGVATDVTERSRAAAEMSRFAYYDHLTLLPNRRLFHDRLQMLLTQAKREQNRVGLMLIDLDRFKPVNDNLGHAVGDLLLKAVAARMQDCLRESDTLARIGGDEFVVLLPGLGSEMHAMGVAEKIRQALNEPFSLAGGYKVSIACCIGIAIYPDHGKEEKRLMKNADDAMYAAKEAGRNRVQLFKGTAGAGERSDVSPRRRSLVRLVWHHSYRCGEPSIDQDHFEVFDRANQLIQASMEFADEPARLSAALDNMIQCVSTHFQQEEKVLARYRYPDQEQHALQHRYLISQLGDVWHRADSGELTIGDLVTFLVQEVVVKHLFHEDRKFFPMLKEAMSRERAAADGLANER